MSNEKVHDPGPPRPRDGPSTQFQADAIVQDLLRGDKEYFGLVLTTAWPPPEKLRDAYSKLKDLIISCFDESDTKSDNGPPAVYVYPADHLHITIATFEHMQRMENCTLDTEDCKHKWSDVLHRVSQSPQWPTKAFQFEVDRSQIGDRAGILLWKETSGGISTVRRLIAEEAKAMGLKVAAIPGIVHTTFLRFHQIPKTPGAKVQERFHNIVLPNLATIFAEKIAAPHVKLVCERTPYMHVTDDSTYVWRTKLLNDANT